MAGFAGLINRKLDEFFDLAEDEPGMSKTPQKPAHKRLKENIPNASSSAASTTQQAASKAWVQRAVVGAMGTFAEQVDQRFVANEAKLAEVSDKANLAYDQVQCAAHIQEKQSQQIETMKAELVAEFHKRFESCLLYTSPSPRDS